MPKVSIIVPVYNVENISKKRKTWLNHGNINERRDTATILFDIFLCIGIISS